MGKIHSIGSVLDIKRRELGARNASMPANLYAHSIKTGFKIAVAMIVIWILITLI